MSRGFVIAGVLAFLAPVAGAVAFVVTDDATPTRSTPPVAQPRARPAKAPAVSFSGSTSQRKEIAFEVTAGGRKLQGLHVSYRAQCGGKGGLAFELDDVFYTPVSVRPDGTFSARAVGKRLTFSGRIVGRRAAGHVTVDYDYGGVFVCKTPKLAWTADA